MSKQVSLTTTLWFDVWPYDADFLMKSVFENDLLVLQLWPGLISSMIWWCKERVRNVSRNRFGQWVMHIPSFIISNLVFRCGLSVHFPIPGVPCIRLAHVWVSAISLQRFWFESHLNTAGHSWQIVKKLRTHLFSFKDYIFVTDSLHLIKLVVFAT